MIKPSTHQMLVNRTKIVKQRRLMRKDAPHPLSTLVLTVDVQPTGGRVVFVDAPRARKKPGIVNGQFRDASANLEAVLQVLRPRREWERAGDEALGNKLAKLLRGVRTAKKDEVGIIVSE